MWGATRGRNGRCIALQDFNPRTPCGVRHDTITALQRLFDFNPRTPCGVRHGAVCNFHAMHHFNPRTPCGVRPAGRSTSASVCPFQSTHPVWGATRTPQHVREVERISIHAPRVGCDRALPRCPPRSVNFNPRTPCGVRRGRACGIYLPTRFQSTHPVWGATQNPRFACSNPQISIHAPRVGCDYRRFAHGCRDSNFNPRTPCGVRLLLMAVSTLFLVISIHAPRVGCDELTYDANEITAISIHAPRVGCDLQHLERHRRLLYFNPRTPCGVRREVGVRCS